MFEEKNSRRLPISVNQCSNLQKYSQIWRHWHRVIPYPKSPGSTVSKSRYPASVSLNSIYWDQCSQLFPPTYRQFFHLDWSLRKWSIDFDGQNRDEARFWPTLSIKSRKWGYYFDKQSPNLRIELEWCFFHQVKLRNNKIL